MQTLSFPCAPPNENGCLVSCLHLGEQILVSNSFVFHFVFYFISGYFFLLVYFFSFAIKTLSRSNLFQTRENNVPLFYLASRQGSCSVIKKKCKQKPFYMATSCIFKDQFMSHEFFLVSVLLLFFGKGQCDSSKFETLIVSV